LLAEIQVSLDTFGGTKVVFVGRFDPRGSPYTEVLLCTPWDKSLKW
jgi:hypothetical protein